MKYETIVSERIVKPVGEPIFSEMSSRIGVADEAAGEFVYVKQQGRTDVGTVFIDPREWPILRDAIDATMVEVMGRGK